MDLVQRLMRLLDSEAALVTEQGPRTWGLSNALALAALVDETGTAWPHLDVYHHWFYPVLIGWAISLATAWWQERQDRVDDTSFALDATWALRRASGWKKRRHPGARVQKLRPRWMESAYWLTGAWLWCLVSPLALVLQGGQVVA